MNLVRSRTRVQRHAFWGFLFVLPFLTLVGVFQLVPIASTIGMAFTDRKGANPEEHWVGLDNFGKPGTSFQVQGLSGEEARRLVGALTAAGFDAFTDAPEEESGPDPYAISAPTDGEEVTNVPDGGYSVKLLKQDPVQTSAVRALLLEQGLSADAIAASMQPGDSGLVFDRFFWSAMGNTLLLFAMSFVPQVVLAMLFAVWFSDTRLSLRWRGFYKALFYVPSILLTSAVIVFFSTLVTYPTGPLNSLLVHVFGLSESINLLRHDFWTRALIALIQFWLLMGTTLIYLSAGILGIPATTFEAARVDGARPRQIFWRITLPLLRPILLFVLITSLISGLQLFDIPFLLGGYYGGYNGTMQTVAKYLYSLSFSSAYNLSYGATISTGLVIITLALSAVVVRLLHSSEDDPRGKQ